MKKKLLFVMNDLRCGGAEKSLISLLETLDDKLVEVDLLLFKHEGTFMDRIPPHVHLLEEPAGYRFFDMPLRTAIQGLMKKGKVLSAMARIAAGYIFRTEANPARCEQRVWKYLSMAMSKLSGTYDVAVGYLEKTPIYYVVDKVTAKTKLGWIHTNYANSGMDHRLDDPYFNKLANVITVSAGCEAPLQQAFPALSSRIKIIHNIVSPMVIQSLADNPVDYEFPDNKENHIILTVARLSHVKGIDLAIEACRILVDQGYPVRWHVLGAGAEGANYSKLIMNKRLQDHFILLGAQENPYPYVKGADIYVQPSRLEGKSIAIDEAKILGKPIIVTNAASEQINHEQNGLVVDMNPSSIAQAVIRLLDDPILRNRLMEGLATEQMGTEEEVDKLYSLMI